MAKLRGGTTIGGIIAETIAGSQDKIDIHNNITNPHSATSANTASRLVLRDSSGNFSAGTITANLSGNASTATKWAAAKTITLSGSVTGSTSIDGSGNVSITTVTNHSHGSANYDNDYLDSLSFNTANGILTAAMAGTNSLSSRTIDLDGRYLELASRNTITSDSSTTESLLHLNATSNAGSNATLLSGYIASNTTDRYFVNFSGTGGDMWKVSTDGTLRAGTVPWARLSSIPTYDNYVSWTIKNSSDDTGATVGSGQDVQIIGGTNVTTTRNGRNITIDSTDTNTTYSEITTAEIDTGTASTLRTITARRLQYAFDNVKAATAGIADSANAVTWANVTGKPSTFAPSSHTHTLSNITDSGDLASINTNSSTSNYLRGDGTWVTPPNTTYSAMSVNEGQTGTATTSRVMRADYLKSIIEHRIGLTNPKSHDNSQHSTNYTPESRTLTINGTALNLTSNRSWSVGTVTSVGAGNGMSFTTITGSGSVAMGTPSTLTASTSNGVTATSHTHAITTTSVGTANTIVQTNASGNVQATDEFRFGNNAFMKYNSGTESIDFVFAV